MNTGLLILERMIIESLSKKEKNIMELIHDTNLDQRILLNLLPSMILKKYLNYNRGQYSLNKENALLWKDTINSKENVKEEVKELFSTLVNQYFKEEIPEQGGHQQLKVQKVNLTKDELTTLKSHLLSIENFISDVRRRRLSKPTGEKTFEQKVLIMGYAPYDDLTRELLANV